MLHKYKHVSLLVVFGIQWQPKTESYLTKRDDKEKNDL